jgi:uncharacterized protein (DUF362 family)
MEKGKYCWGGDLLSGGLFLLLLGNFFSLVVEGVRVEWFTDKVVDRPRMKHTILEILYF